MTQEEMQRFLDMASGDGIPEADALKRLAQIIGIAYHPGKGAEKEQEKT